LILGYPKNNARLVSLHYGTYTLSSTGFKSIATLKAITGFFLQLVRFDAVVLVSFYTVGLE